MTKVLDWRIKDKLISLQNKTHLSEVNIVSARNYIQKKYKLGLVEALQYLIMSYADKRMILVDSISNQKENILKNLEDL